MNAEQTRLKYSDSVKESMQQSYCYRFNDVPTLEIMNERKEWQAMTQIFTVLQLMFLTLYTKTVIQEWKMWDVI